MIQTRQQKLAQTIYKNIQAIHDTNEPWAKEYGRLCMNFPALLYTNGLCQTIAFYEAKAASNGSVNGKNKEHINQFLNHLQEVLSVSNLKEIQKVDVTCYLILTRQALEAGNWFKRYAEAILKVESGEQNGVNSVGEEE